MGLGQYQRSIEDFDNAIKLDPEHADALGNRGIAHLNLGQYQRAIKDFDRAIHLESNNAAAFITGRGAAYANLGRHQQAIENYNQAIKLDPEYAWAYKNRGISYNKLGQSARACVDFWKACYSGECDSLGREQKKGFCKDPAGTFFIDTDEDRIYISTDECGKFIIYSKKNAASIKPGTQGIYFIGQNKRGTYIRTDRYGDFYLEPERLSKDEARERARQKTEWNEMFRESAVRDKTAISPPHLNEWPDKVLNAQKKAEAAQSKLEIQEAKASAPMIAVPPPVGMGW
jgi:tetratricopeptide (TPR) repeat protein